MNKRWQLTLAVAASVTAAACSDSSNGSDPGTPPTALSFVQLAPTAPPLCADSVGKWFVKNPSGSSDELALTFPESGNQADCPGGQTEDFLRLRVGGTSLLRRPDGTAIANGDSVFISVRWVGNDSILFEMQPSGLLFDPANPVRLRIEYGEAGEDLNDDNQVTSADTTIEHQLDIWRQERLGDPFFRVGTSRSEDANEIEAMITGFSRFALAY